MSRRDGGSFRGITRRPCPCMLDVKVGHGIHHGKRTGTQYTRVRVSLLSIATAKSSPRPRGHWRDCVQTGKPPTMAEFSCFSLSISPTHPTLPALALPRPAPSQSSPWPSWLTGAVSDANTDVMTIGHEAHRSSAGPLECVRPESPDACLFRGLNPSIQ